MRWVLVVMVLVAFMIGSLSSQAETGAAVGPVADPATVKVIAVRPRDPDVKPVIVTMPVGGSRSVADNAGRDTRRAAPVD